MDKIALLKKVGLFCNLSEGNLDSIAEFCVERSFREGDVIIKQGDSGEATPSCPDGGGETDEASRCWMLDPGCRIK